MMESEALSTDEGTSGGGLHLVDVLAAAQPADYSSEEEEEQEGQGKAIEAPRRSYSGSADNIDGFSPPKPSGNSRIPALSSIVTRATSLAGNVAAGRAGEQDDSLWLSRVAKKSEELRKLFGLPESEVRSA